MGPLSYWECAALLAIILAAALAGAADYGRWAAVPPAAGDRYPEAVMRSIDV